MKRAAVLLYVTALMSVGLTKMFYVHAVDNVGSSSVVTTLFWLAALYLVLTVSAAALRSESIVGPDGIALRHRAFLAHAQLFEDRTGKIGADSLHAVTWESREARDFREKRLSIVVSALLIVALSVAVAFLSPLLAVVLLTVELVVAAVSLRFLARSELWVDKTSRSGPIATNAMAGAVRSRNDFLNFNLDSFITDKIAGLERTFYEEMRKFLLWNELVAATRTVAMALKVPTILVLATMGRFDSATSIIAAFLYMTFLDDEVDKLVSKAAALRKFRVFYDKIRSLPEYEDALEPHPVVLPIDLQDAEITCDGHRILNRVDLKVDPGEKIAIIGPSGSGKTTLLKFLRGLLGDQTNNNVGRNMVPSAFIPAKPAMLNGSLYANVDMNRDLPHDEAVNNLRNVGLSNVSKEKILEKLGPKGRQISDGERQRVALSRAENHRLLLVDEPSATLNPSLEQDLLDRYLADPELTMICTTHKLSTAKRFQKIYLVDGGTIRLLVDDTGPDKEAAMNELSRFFFNQHCEATHADS